MKSWKQFFIQLAGVIVIAGILVAVVINSWNYVTANDERIQAAYTAGIGLVCAVATFLFLLSLKCPLPTLWRRFRHCTKHGEK